MFRSIIANSSAGPLLFLLSTIVGIAQQEWLPEENPLFNSSLLASAGGAALANSLVVGNGNDDQNELDGIGQGLKRDEYRSEFLYSLWMRLYRSQSRGQECDPVHSRTALFFAQWVGWAEQHQYNGRLSRGGLRYWKGDDTELTSSTLGKKASEASLASNDPILSMLFDYPELSSSLNKTLNPCDNFYEFVCSGWKVNICLLLGEPFKNNIIPAKASNWRGQNQRQPIPANQQFVGGSHQMLE